MANTTNYNWETPDDTDLVKDGAAAIRTLGSSIDTTTKALNPETTLGDIAYRSATANTNTRLAIGSNGQVLTVASGVPSWATPTTGDIEGVTAGTGISGGGTSGTVTITNDMATTITASGDIVVGTGSGTYDNLPIGTTGQVLTADTTVSPYKVKWAAAASGSTFSGCSLYKSTDQSIANATTTIITFDSENYDVDGYHDNSTNNSRITIPSGKAGKFLFAGCIAWGGNTTGQRNAYLYKNGSAIRNLVALPPIQIGTDVSIIPFSTVVDAAVGDYFELAGMQDRGAALDAKQGSNRTTFNASYLGA